MPNEWLFIGLFLLMGAIFPGAPIIINSLILGPKKNSTDYGVYGIPQTVIIDRKGVIRDIRVGYDPGGEASLRAEIEKF